MAESTKVYQPLPLHLDTNVEEEVESNLLITSVDQVLNWSRRC